MHFVVLAPGPSMSQSVADSVRGENVICVNNTFELAPWALALCAQDYRWWRAYPAARDFAGRKFTTNVIDGIERILDPAVVATGSSSGLLGLEVARSVFGATSIDLYGFDNHGTHYFGKHPDPLRHTHAARFQVFNQQFTQWARQFKDVRVVNRTPGSALTAFPFE